MVGNFVVATGLFVLLMGFANYAACVLIVPLPAAFRRGAGLDRYKPTNPPCGRKSERDSDFCD